MLKKGPPFKETTVETAAGFVITKAQRKNLLFETHWIGIFRKAEVRWMVVMSLDGRWRIRG